MKSLTDKAISRTSMSTIVSALKVLAIITVVIIIALTAFAVSANAEIEKLSPQDYGINTTGTANIDDTASLIQNVLKIIGILILSLASVLGMWYIISGFMKMAKDDNNQEKSLGKKIGVGFILVLLSLVIAVVWGTMSGSGDGNQRNNRPPAYNSGI